MAVMKSGLVNRWLELTVQQCPAPSKLRPYGAIQICLLLLLLLLVLQVILECSLLPAIRHPYD